MELNPPHSSLPVPIKFSYGARDIIGEGSRPTDTDENAISTSRTLCGGNNIIQKFGDLRAPRCKGDTGGKEVPLERCLESTGVEYRNPDKERTVLSNEGSEERYHGH